MQHGRDASEADITVLENQLRNNDPLDQSELAFTIGVDTEQPVSIQSLSKHLTVMAHRHSTMGVSH